MAKAKKKNFKVVGLDLSISATGIADANGTTLTVGGKSALGDKRLAIIADAVEQLLPADLIIIEDLPTHAHGAGITGMVHGAVRTVLVKNEAKYILVTPASLKKYATGKGNAGKPEMAVALYKNFNMELKDDNQVDAFWLRAMGLDYLGEPLIAMPSSHRSAMEKVLWEK